LKCENRRYLFIFILLMAGTLSVYHWPLQPIKVKPKKNILKKTEKGNIQVKYKVLMLRGSHEKKIVIIK
jgi:hypothetical protein